MRTLKGKTVFITGASRGIGREIALRFARGGAQVVVTGKTAEPHPKLKGTIYSVAEEVEREGGRALALQLDVRDEAALRQAVERTAERFGGIDVLVNNASAISLTGTLETPMKRFDLMMAVNLRATFAASQTCVPYLKRSVNPHILTLSPPLNLDPRWFKDHLAYTISKYGMSLCTLGMAAELAPDGIAVNSLWPKTIIATAAIEFNFPPELLARSRTPAIVADAAYAIVTKDSRRVTGNFFLDEDVLRAEGVEDFQGYAVNPGQPLFPDLFVD
ncbi:MAG: NAD(P)-dependent oxidoreductase [Pseudomonadota bacterium]